MNKFELTSEEVERIRKWDKNHFCTLTTEGAIGGRLTYSFTPTGLGVVTEVECACGAKIDLTDYDSW